MIFMICTMYAAIAQSLQLLLSFVYMAALVLCVTRDPTSAASVILTFVLILVVVAVSYVHYFLFVSHVGSMGSPTQKRGGEVYVQVQDDGEGDMELSAAAQSQSQLQEPSSANLASEVPSLYKGVLTALHRCRYSIAGGVCGVLGLTCFALQAAGDYYVLHSLWHLGMMLAAFCMLRGREDWMDLLQIQRDLL